MNKSRDIQKATCKPQEVETVADKFQEVLQAIYKHTEVLVEIGIPAANFGSGTEYILQMISGQRILTSLAMKRFWRGFLEMLQLKIISSCILMIKWLIILSPKQTFMQHNTLKKNRETLNHIH